jgi:hypothetical protein
MQEPHNGCVVVKQSQRHLEALASNCPAHRARSIALPAVQRCDSRTSRRAFITAIEAYLLRGELFAPPHPRRRVGTRACGVKLRVEHVVAPRRVAYGTIVVPVKPESPTLQISCWNATGTASQYHAPASRDDARAEVAVLVHDVCHRSPGAAQILRRSD